MLYRMEGCVSTSCDNVATCTYVCMRTCAARVHEHRNDVSVKQTTCCWLLVLVFFNFKICPVSPLRTRHRLTRAETCQDRALVIHELLSQECLDDILPGGDLFVYGNLHFNEERLWGGPTASIEHLAHIIQAAGRQQKIRNTKR